MQLTWKMPARDYWASLIIHDYARKHFLQYTQRFITCWEYWNGKKVFWLRGHSWTILHFLSCLFSYDCCLFTFWAVCLLMAAVCLIFTVCQLFVYFWQLFVYSLSCLFTYDSCLFTFDSCLFTFSSCWGH